MSAKFAPRIHVLLARDRPFGVILRRGPSQSVCSLGWDRRTDTFTVGQWLRGRIYERRADLSPDGRHLIYFAMNGRLASETGGAWTAISRAPYLKAVALFAKGDCWHGGGLFLSNTRYWLNDGYGHKMLLASSNISRDQTWQPEASYGGECLHVYFNRLQRDGWTLRETETNAHDSAVVFDRPLGGGWILRKFAHCDGTRTAEGKGVYYDTHALLREDSDEVIDGSNWEWAERDGTRLVWAEAGCLHAARLTRRGLTDPRVLHDFNNLRFEALAAPY